jgi:putative transposase
MTRVGTASSPLGWRRAGLKGNDADLNLRPDKAVKQFTAYDPVARFTAAKAFSTARAGCAKNFLDKLLFTFPFKLKGIQVDGGLEFMAEFEQACKDKGLALFVLPPKRPDLTGAVERAQGSWRYEFYACHNLPHRLDRLNEHIDAFAHLYNRASQHPFVYVIEENRLC